MTSNSVASLRTYTLKTNVTISITTVELPVLAVVWNHVNTGVVVELVRGGVDGRTGYYRTYKHRVLDPIIHTRRHWVHVAVLQISSSSSYSDYRNVAS